jgi:hypothetical protein
MTVIEMADIKHKTKPKPKSGFKEVDLNEEQLEDDFVLKGKSAENFYHKIMSPPKNEKRDQFTQNALRIFPDPTKPTTITLKIKDE